MSEKLDGIRAYWDGEKLISRGGKIIYAPPYFKENFPSFELDGELWSKRGAFDSISSIVRDKEPSQEWKEISYNIFEVPNAKGNLFERLEKVKPYESTILKIIPQRAVKSKENMLRFLKSIEKKGGEGVVVRDPNAEYINHRTSKALKVKSFLDTECRVLGYSDGKGKNAGKMGALVCQLKSGIVFKIGSGFSNAERKNPPKIGSEVSFKYKELTKNGKPRFPVFLRVRE
jgi:DNA ligase-1